MKAFIETRQSKERTCKETTGKNPKSMLLMASLFPSLVGMTVAGFSEERPYWTPPQYSRSPDPFPLHEIARSYGITEALERSPQFERAAETRKEVEKLMEAQRRDRELRKKVAELANTSYKLYQRLNNPSEIHADTPELAKQCEKLSKAIRKLLR